MIVGKIRKVACAMSGGVDSSVAAAILKRKGYEVVGVFMKNWDQANELGECRADHDWEDASYACRNLDIPLVSTNFVKEYWNDVFSEMLTGYESGMTPNPDVLCNKHIKFGAFFRHVMHNMDVDALATGHYAQNSYGNFLEKPHIGNARLLIACDRWKDQTLFLAQMPQSALRKTMFPVGAMLKRDVKVIAKELGLERIVNKKESMGICFIGSRKFSKFIELYIEPNPGVFINIETGKVIGTHKGSHYWTVGQGTRLTVTDRHPPPPFYVVSVDPTTQNIYTAPGTHHPSLYHDEFFTEPPYWIDQAPADFNQNGRLQCDFKFQHIHRLQSCTIHLAEAHGNSDELRLQKKHDLNNNLNNNNKRLADVTEYENELTDNRNRTHNDIESVYNSEQKGNTVNENGSPNKHTLRQNENNQSCDNCFISDMSSLKSDERSSELDSPSKRHASKFNDSSSNDLIEPSPVTGDPWPRPGDLLTRVTLERPIRALTVGQFATFYRGEECLGSARIVRLGASLYERGVRVASVEEGSENEERFA